MVMEQGMKRRETMREVGPHGPPRVLLLDVCGLALVQDACRREAADLSGLAAYPRRTEVSSSRSTLCLLVSLSPASCPAAGANRRCRMPFSDLGPQAVHPRPVRARTATCGAGASRRCRAPGCHGTIPNNQLRPNHTQQLFRATQIDPTSTPINCSQASYLAPARTNRPAGNPAPITATIHHIEKLSKIPHPPFVIPMHTRP